MVYDAKNKSGTIVVIDDEANNIKAVELALSGYNYNVISFLSPEEGLKSVKERSPDIILLDIMMPTISGYDVAARIRDGNLSNAPIMFLTSINDNDARKAAYEVGADDYITKPIVAEELAKKINKKLESRKRIEESEEKWQTIKSIVEDILPHEINTPLAIFQMGSQNYEATLTDFDKHIKKLFDLVESKYPKLALEKEYINVKMGIANIEENNKIVKEAFNVSSKRLEKLVKKIVYYNRQFEINKAKTNIKELIIHILKNYQEDISFFIESFEANIDAKLVEEAVKVLIDNSIIHNQGNATIMVSAQNKKDNFTITVTDNGKGIDKESQPHVFKPYFLAHASLNHSEGIGLGLYFVKKVSEIHNGSVSLFSEPGFKTEITLNLPI